MKPFSYSSRLILCVLILFLDHFASSQKVIPGNKAGTNLLRFKNYSYVDRQGTGIEAFSFLMPSDWKFEGGIQWILDNPAMPSVRVSYTKDGTTMEEEFYAVVESITFPVQSMSGTFYNTIWYVDYIFSFKAQKGKLESNAKIFQTITASFKVNPHWFAKYSNVIEYMAQQKISQIKSVGEFSRMLSRMSDQVSEEKMQQFKERGDIYDKVSQKFSDNTLGIDRYFNPNEEKEVELPSGYNHAWCNNNGEYVLSHDPNFNPNEGSNLHWESMKRK